MKSTEQAVPAKFSRRGFFGGAGAALGGATLGAAAARTGTTTQQCGPNGCQYPNDASTARYGYPGKLRKFTPDMQPDLGADEMRITFLGTASPPPRRGQRTMSIFVEVGPWMRDPGGGFGKAKDSFVFDCGAAASRTMSRWGSPTAGWTGSSSRTCMATI